MVIGTPPTPYVRGGGGYPGPPCAPSYHSQRTLPGTQALRVLLYGPSRLSGLSEIGWYEVPGGAEDHCFVVILVMPPPPVFLVSIYAPPPGSGPPVCLPRGGWEGWGCSGVKLNGPPTGCAEIPDARTPSPLFFLS